MPNVINLESAREELKPHLSGEAKCVDCGHEYVAVAPVGLLFMECPKCHHHRAAYKYPCERPGKHWACNCGFQYFLITPEGVYCPRCGDWQRGF